MRRAALTLVLLLGACSGAGDAASPRPSVPEAGAEETATIDRILTGLDGVMGDAQRALVRERRITPEVTDGLRSVYVGPELLNQIDAFRADVANGLVSLKDPPGNRVTTVSRLITVSPICIFVEVTRDYSPLTRGAAPRPASLYVVLVTKDEADDPRRLNPTPWAMLYDGVQVDGSQPG
ncbi:MAG TPA: hypothetical protein VNT52_08740, partial [Acidimicrobiales bacterium]|nr:hypothetical protein [Acidimicrobiales bacterium]